MSPETVARFCSIREVIAELHRLVAQLKDERDAVRRMIKVTYAGIELRKLRELMSAKIAGPLPGAIMTGFLDANKLATLAPPMEEKVPGGMRTTRGYQKYVESIDPWRLEVHA